MKKANRLQNSTHMHDSIKVKQDYILTKQLDNKQIIFTGMCE